jgi:hypothetical protein
VVRQLLESLAGDRDPQGTQFREIGRRQVPGMMHLAEHHVLRRTAGGSPVVHTSFQRPAMTILELPRVLLLDPVEERLGLQRGLVLEERFHPGPDFRKRILPRPVRTRRLE